MNLQERIDAYTTATKFPRSLFRLQRHNATRRGIAFLFDYEAWVAWWEYHLGLDWVSKRGCTRGKYCMARIGDTGPYSPGNVKCILHSDNVTDAAANDVIAHGVSAGHARLTPGQVVVIFKTDVPVKALTQRLNISAGTICDIRSGRTWRRVTRGLSRTSLRGNNQWT